MTELFNANSNREYGVGTLSAPITHMDMIKTDWTVVVCCTGGVAFIEIEMCRHILNKGAVAIVLPGSTMEFLQSSDDFHATYALFTSDVLWEVCTPLPPDFFGVLKTAPCLCRDTELFTATQVFMSALTKCCRNETNRYQTTIARNIIQCYMLDIYDRVSNLTQGNCKRSNRREELFRRFVRLVPDYCMHEREVAFYARQLCITPRYLSSVVRSVSGETAKAIIDKHVILEIKACLKSTDLTVQEISNRFCFPNQTFFGCYFRKHTGMSPSVFRTKA